MAMSSELIDGFTLDELADYLESGMTPANPAIDDSPSCRLALDALRSVEAATARAIELHAASLPRPDPSWVTRIIDTISLDVRRGRTIPLGYADSGLVLTTTEAALRGLVRAAGDDTPGVLVGRCTLEGDPTEPGAALRLRLDVAVYWGRSIPAVVARLQETVAAAIRDQTDLVVAEIDVTVHDIHAPTPPQEPS